MSKHKNCDKGVKLAGDSGSGGSRGKFSSFHGRAWEEWEFTCKVEQDM